MRARLALALAAPLLVLAACGYAEEVETENIVSAIPWEDGEQTQYVILSSNDLETELSRGTLTATSTNGDYELRLAFESEEGTDEAMVVVDAETLKPKTVRRDFEFLDKVVEGTYDPDEMIIEVVEIEDGERRVIPARLEEHYYDNESSLFLWRTITFEEGYEASYNSVLANSGGETKVVTIRVDGREEITVPAGTFETWRVLMHSEDFRQTIWFATTPDHVMVQYDNSLGQIFQLTEASVRGS